MSADGRRPGFAADRRGATAAELALVLPVLVILIYGVVQLGWVQHCRSSLAFALEQASRSLRLDPALDDGAVQTLVRGKLTAMPPEAVTVSVARTAGPAGPVATLTGAYAAHIDIPLVGTVPVAVSSTVTTPLP